MLPKTEGNVQFTVARAQHCDEIQKSTFIRLSWNATPYMRGPFCRQDYFSAVIHYLYDIKTYWAQAPRYNEYLNLPNRLLEFRPPPSQRIVSKHLENRHHHQWGLRKGPFKCPDNETTDVIGNVTNGNFENSPIDRLNGPRNIYRLCQRRLIFFLPYFYVVLHN